MTTEIRAPAGRPSRIGLAVTVTLSPGRNDLGRIPAWSRVDGPSASKPHSTGLPSAPVTITISHE